VVDQRLAGFALLAGADPGSRRRNPGGSGGGKGGAVPDIATLPEPVRIAVQEAYGSATADLFLISTPIAVLALVAVLFIKEKSLLTTSASERMATEGAAAAPDDKVQDVR
jgi:hypothetical protein